MNVTHLTDDLDPLDPCDEMDDTLLVEPEEPTLLKDGVLATLPPPITVGLMKAAFACILIGGPSSDFTCGMLRWITL